MPALCQYRGNSAQPQEERKKTKRMKVNRMKQTKTKKTTKQTKNACSAFHLHLGQTHR